MDRKAEVERRTNLLVENFDRYVSAFDRRPAFDKFGQKENHIATIRRRTEVGSAVAAIRDDRFLDLLRETLKAWGIGQRGAVLVERGSFHQALRKHESEIVALEGRNIDDPDLDVPDTTKQIWNLVEMLEVVENDAKLVSSTKALHHILPSLVVPMDRKFTRTFFCWHVPEFQYQQRRVFRHAYEYFVAVARATSPSQYATGAGWRTSRTKVIDNALVACCVEEKFPIPS